MSLVSNVIEYLVQHPNILICGILLYFLVVGLLLYFNGKKKGLDPFRLDARRTPRPLVTDKVARAAILKQGFAVKKIPKQVDAIVIGSGIGGLSTAALLAKAGKKVLVLEQHDQAGGCCHVYEENGFEFDVGIHYIGEMRNNTFVRAYMEQLTEGQLQWCDLIDEFDVVAIGEVGKQKLYPFCAGGKDGWKKAMLKQFPAEGDALDKFLSLLTDVRKSMLGMVSFKVVNRTWCKVLIKLGLARSFTQYFDYSKKTVRSVLSKLTDNPDLQTVLAYSYGDYGTPPHQGSFAMHAALLNHYIYGASYPRGGASEIPFHIIPVIEQAGGRVLVRAPVSQIVFEQGRAVGVKVKKGTDKIEVRAPIIISDAGVVNTMCKLTPKEIAQKTYQYPHLKKGSIHCGHAAISIFVGLNGTTEELQLKPQNVWAFTSNNLVDSFESYMSQAADEAVSNDVPLLFISFPSTKDPTYNIRYPGKTVCTIVTLANWEWFSKWQGTKHGSRSEEYDAFKNAIGRRAWEQTLALFPQLRDKVEYFQVGSPVSNQFYINAAQGEIYGLDHSIDRFGDPDVIADLRPETGVAGLFLTGQDVMSAGLIGAALGGLLCASKVLNRNLWDDLVAFKKRQPKAQNKTQNGPIHNRLIQDKKSQ